ncbi:MAG: type II/IV secretion system protein, partial [Anaerolineae bacterium]|nr:type II/IV secretion system protein [Phycisphaerae bacterium]
MSSALRKSLVDLLVASGVENADEAQALAAKQNNGHSWTVEVLNSGKVDEGKFTRALGELFRTPVAEVNLDRIDRAVLGSLPSRFVFKHHILPLRATDTSVQLATYDVFNTVGRRLAAQLLKRKIEWVLVPRTQLLRAIKTLYGVGAETFEELLQSNRTFDAGDEGVQAMDIDEESPEA